MAISCRFGRDERDPGVVRRPSQNQSELTGRHGPARSAGNDHGNASNLARASIQDDLVKEARIAAARPHLALAQRPLGSRSQGEQQEVESHRIAIAGEQTALGLVDSCHSVGSGTRARARSTAARPPGPNCSRAARRASSPAVPPPTIQTTGLEAGAISPRLDRGHQVVGRRPAITVAPNADSATNPSFLPLRRVPIPDGGTRDC
jgi:hypothetical protein